MPRAAVQARKKKVTKSEPAPVAPPVEEAPAAEAEAEPEEVEEAPTQEGEEGNEMEVSLEPTEGEEEDVPEPGDEILEDDNNNDAEELLGEEVNEEDLIEMEEADDDEEEGGEDGDGEEEGDEEAAEGGEENGEGKKRKATGKQAVPKKKLKVEPKPVRMNVYVKRVASETIESSLETFLRDNEVEMKEFTANTDPVWALAGQLTLTKPEDKDKALGLTGQEVESCEVKFEPIEEKSLNDEPLKKLQAPDEVILFVRNFPKTTVDEDLKKIFPACVELHVPQKNGRSKGFAFLQFGSKEEVQEMIKNKQGVDCGGRKLALGRFSSREGKSTRANTRYQKTKDQAGNSQNKVLFVGNLSFDTKEDKIMRIFRTAESVKILRFANTGKSKGVAFIEFRTPLAAKKAFEKYSSYKIDGRAINLEYADQDKFKTGDRSQARSPGRRLSGGAGGRSSFNTGRPFRGGQIRSLLDNMQYERSMEYDNRMMRGMDRGMGMGGRMGLDGGLGMGLDRGLGGRMGLDSSLGLDGGYGGRMSMDSGLSSRMVMDSGLGGRMSLDGGMGRRMGLDSGFGMSDRLGLDSYGGRMSMDSGMGSYGGRMGGMDSGSYGGGFKNRSMGQGNRMRQGNRKSWN